MNVINWLTYACKMNMQNNASLFDFILVLCHVILRSLPEGLDSSPCNFTGPVCQLWGLRTMQPDLHRPSLVCVYMSWNIPCQDMVYIRWSRCLPRSILNIGADGSQLLQDICFLWVSPCMSDDKQSRWQWAYHIHLSLSLKDSIQLVSQLCLMLFIIKECCNPCFSSGAFRLSKSPKFYGFYYMEVRESCRACSSRQLWIIKIIHFSWRVIFMTFNIKTESKEFSQT